MDIKPTYALNEVADLGYLPEDFFVSLTDGGKQSKVRFVGFEAHSSEGDTDGINQIADVVHAEFNKRKYASINT